MTASPGRATNPVRVWDAPTRLFHWALVLLVASAWITYRFAEDFGDARLWWHRLNGYTILVLIVWRLLWGFGGSHTARFASFLRGPAATTEYARKLITGRAPRYLGHNPLGAWMITALLGVLMVQSVMGLFAIDDNGIIGGPLNRLVAEPVAKQLTRWHAWFYFWVILSLAALHITANLYYTLVKKQPVIPAMVTGDMPAGTYQDSPGVTQPHRPVVWAVVYLLLAVLIVMGPLYASGGRLL